MQAPRSTPHKDSPGATLFVQQLGDAPPAIALFARQRGIKARPSRGTQCQEAPLGQRLQARWYGRITPPLPGRQQFGHDFSPIGDQNGLSQPYPAEILA